MRLLFLLFLPIIHAAICPEGYFLVNEKKCLKMYWNKASQPVAESNCKNDGGTLVIIRNAIDNQAVYNFANQAGVSAIWIGLSCFNITTTASSCFWDDASGNAASYSNFYSGTTLPRGYCTIMGITTPYYPAKWITTDCGYQSVYSPYPYVCEVPLNEGYCSGYSCSCFGSYKGYCYTKSNVPVNGTSASCGNPTSIHSKMEIDYIRRLYRNTDTTHIYIGAQAQLNDRFEWSDGTKWDFDYTNPLLPKNGKCMVMDVQGYGLWNQVDCAEKYNFLCKYKQVNRPFGGLAVESEQVTADQGSIEEEKIEELDSSNCNSTLYLAPGSISSFGYPNYNSAPSYCTWELRALGPYQLGIYFDFWATYGALNVFDERGNNIAQFVGAFDKPPFSKIAPHNVARVTFEPRPKAGTQVDRGFHAFLIPV